MAKLKIYEYNEYYRGLMTDNTSGSTIIGFDGNFNRPESEKFDYGINISYLLNYTSPCTFLSLGAGGGMDVLQALFGDAEEIHAVEVNPHINYLMTDGELASFSGNIYKNPKVKVITEDARAYIRRFENKFDIIFARNSNSYAALASGAFALAENYLFTTEAFTDYWNALSDKGFIVMDHQSYVHRMISSVLNALKERGIESAEKHIAVYESIEFRRKIILISKQQLSKQLIFFAIDELKTRNTNRLRLLYPAFDNSPDNLETKIIEQGWEVLANDVSTDISPTEDDKPFIAQLGLWKNFQSASLEKVLPSDEFYGFPISQLLILIIIILTIIIILPLNLLPYLKIKSNKTLKFPNWIYFFLIGVAYMAIEVVLIQKYTLFLGPSVYGLITILSVMLISSGIGSRFSNKFSLKIVFVLIVAFVLLDIFLYSELIYIFGSLEVIPRILITILLIFPLGFFMGMPFPKGGLLAGDNIDWAFAVNGSASVLGSGLILLISFNFGFKIALIISAIIYILAFLSVFLNSNKSSK
jgi:spermidine synthase